MTRHSKKSNRRKKPDKFAKQKLLAIPVLLGVLGYFVFTGISGTQPSEVGAAEVLATNSVQTATPDSVPLASSVRGKSKVKPDAWPSANLEFLDGTPPIQNYLHGGVPAGHLTAAQSAGSSGTQRRQSVLSNLRNQIDQQPAQFVFQSGTRKHALVGGRMVAEGDQLAEGVQLQKIQSNTLFLKAVTGVN